MTPKISILHPSWKRPELALHCYNTWMENADKPEEIEYILCLAGKDPKMAQYTAAFAGTENIRICIVSNNGLIPQMNTAAEISSGNLLIGVSDDFVCPMHWDTTLLNDLAGKEDYVVKTQDGQQPWIITLPMMDRAYYDRFGYIYQPDYAHMFGDTEMTHVGDMLGRTITLPHLFEHQHYTSGKNPKDETNEQNDATWSQGEETYLRRLRADFGILCPEQVQLPDHHLQWLKSKGVKV